jgi:hypothetical protein
MGRIMRFNESIALNKTLREVIGDVVDTKRDRYWELHQTEEGCFITNSDILDWEITSTYVRRDGTGEIVLKGPDGRGGLYWLYVVGEDIRAVCRSLGDDRGCVIFGDVFITSGHDGNIMINVETGEFGVMSW